VYERVTKILIRFLPGEFTIFTTDSFGFIRRDDLWMDCRLTTILDHRDAVSQASQPENHAGEPRLSRILGVLNVTTK
jgi:hypothetical protein